MRYFANSQAVSKRMLKSIFAKCVEEIAESGSRYERFFWKYKLLR